MDFCLGNQNAMTSQPSLQVAWSNSRQMQCAPFFIYITGYYQNNASNSQIAGPNQSTQHRQSIAIAGQNAGLVSKIIWQTNYTNKVSLPIKAAWCWNRLLSRSYQYFFHSTEDRLAFVEQNFPGKPTELYNRLTIGAAQADLWRLMVLYKHGGVYMDIDSHLVWPLNRFIEDGTSEIFLRYKSKDATNYFIASAPSNPNIKALLVEVLYRIENSQSNNVYEITGPSVFQDILANKSHTWRLAQHTCLQGNFSNKFFQYLDKPQGCWTQEQKLRRVIQPEQGRQ